MKNWSKRASRLCFCTTFLLCLTASAFSQNMFRKVNDFDGDRKADFAVTRNENGRKIWYVWQSTQGFRAFQWGLDTDKVTAGDYDGDMKTDFAVSRLLANNGYSLYVYQSATNTYYDKSFGSVQPITYIEPIQQDYDGDGKTDRSYILKWNNTPEWKSGFVYESEFNPNIVNFQVNGDHNFLRLGDLSGNGESDIVSVNPANNILTIVDYNDIRTNISRTVQFGIPGDQFVPADFDGDGKGDLTVFRESNGTWWWIRSSDNAVQAAQFGQSGDKPVPADYDGDGKTDLAIWRPGETQSVFWVYGSLGNVLVMPFGIGTDKVVTY